MSLFWNLQYANLAPAVSILGVPAAVFWPYFAGASILGICLPTIVKNDVGAAHGWDKAVPFGRLFFALPMAVFGTEHFVATEAIAGIVPSWIPAPRFWVYAVGIALFAGALSISLNIFARWGALLTGIMLFSFVALIHIPLVAGDLRDRISWTVALRDLSFSGGALAFAGAQAKSWSGRTRQTLAVIGRLWVGPAAIFYGVEHFLHPTFVPGVPLGKVVENWVPVHLVWAYLAGAVLLAAGTGITLNRKSREAAICLGILIFLLVMFVYLPTLVVHPGDIANEINYFTDTLMYSGAVLLLADAMPSISHRQV
jgi:uncharacterized membrane protein